MRCVGWPDEEGCAGSRTTPLGLFHSKFARQRRQAGTYASFTDQLLDRFGARLFGEKTASDQKRIQDEPKLFWDSLTRSFQQVAEDAKQHFDRQLVTRGETVALKISVLQRSRMFFRPELEPEVIRQLAVRFGYIPAGMNVVLLSHQDLQEFYAVNHGCYDFLNTAHNEDGYVRGTSCEFPADGPTCKYTSLFDERPMFDSLREAFLVGARASGRADACSTVVAQVVGDTDILTLQLLEEVTGFTVLTTRWATMVASPDVLEAFATRAWPAYVKCVQVAEYYLSVEGIVLVSAMARVNVAVFSQTGPLLRYEAGFFDGDGPSTTLHRLLVLRTF
jgi:hypothetical protein